MRKQLLSAARHVSRSTIVLLIVISSILALPTLVQSAPRAIPEVHAQTPTVVQSGESIHCSTSDTLTLGSDITEGDGLIVGIAAGSAETASGYVVDVTDSQGNTFTRQVLGHIESLLGPSEGGGLYYSGIYTATAKSTSSDTISLTMKLGGTSTDTCYSIEAIETTYIDVTAISTGTGSGDIGNCCQLNSSLTQNALDFGTALTDDTGKGTWTCKSGYTCLSASPTAFFGGNGVGEYQLITGNQSTTTMGMTYTDAKDVFLSRARFSSKSSRLTLHTTRAT